MFVIYLVQKLHDNQWIESPIFLQNESIRITNRIDSNRELECSTTKPLEQMALAVCSTSWKQQIFF